ncbi:MAG: hypothetical protein ABSG53_14910, partial [Thermoguttaceae bacterium]
RPPAFFSVYDRFQRGFARPRDDPMMKIAVETRLRAMLAASRVGAHDEWLAKEPGHPTIYL